MSVQIKTVDLTPKRHTFGHVARRIGGDKPASRYQEATFDAQPTENFHYRPVWDPQYELHDTRRTAVVMNDWYKPLDPRQYYYATYNIARANMNQSADRNFVFAEERALFAKASPAAIKNICQGLLPLRHVHWGGNMNMLEICQSCYGAAIGNPTMFSATDHLGMAQYISRIGLLIDNQSGSSLHDAKEIWLNDPAWQEIRRLVEDSFVVRDWFELFVIQTLGINGVILPLVYKNAEAAWQDAGLTLALLTETMSDWLTEEARWSDAVIKMVAAESGDNKIFISNWAKHWINRAAEAAKPLSALLLKDDGAAAQTAGTLALKRAAGLGLAV